MGPGTTAAQWVRWLRLALALLLVGAMAPLGMGVSAASQNGDDHKVTICHRTNAENNPYVVITVDKASLFKRGHDTHDEGGVHQPGDKAAGNRWGDIIPAFDYFATPKDQKDGTVSHYDGLNIAEGQTILDSGCEVPDQNPPEPAGNIDGECLEDGSFVVSGSLDDDGADNVAFRLKLSSGSTIPLSGSTFEETIGAQPGTQVHLQAKVGDGDWTDLDNPVTVRECEQAEEPEAPSGSFTTECTATGAQAAVGALDRGDVEGGQFRLVSGNFSAVVTSGQQNVEIPADSTVKLVFVPGAGEQIVLDTEGSPAACPPPPDDDEGKIKIRKVLDGDPLGTDPVFTVHVDCTGTAHDQDVVLDEDNNWVDVTAEIPTGTECELTETDIPAGWNFDGFEPDEAESVTVTVGEGTPQTVSAVVENNRRVGRVQITKVVEGEPAPGTEFTVRLDCPGGDYDEVAVLSAANSWTSELYRGIPSGIICTVTEPTVPAGWTLESITWEVEGTTGTGSFRIDSFATVAVTVTNVPTPPPPTTGAISVTKKLSGLVDGASTSFTFDVDCPGTAHDQSLVVAVTNGTSATGTTTQIPTGLTCTVTERSTPGWTQTGVVPAGGVVAVGSTVTFTNTRTTGAISVTKVVSGPVGGASTSFTFDVDCPGTAHDQSLVVAVTSGTSATSTTKQIPTGLTCTVTERATPDWRQTSVVPAGGVVAVGSTVTFTNQRRQGALQIGKEVSPVAGNGVVVEAGDTLTYTLTVTATGDLQQPNVVVTDYVPGFDPARPASGSTTYVPGSAKCVGAGVCTVTGPGADGLITWQLGHMDGGTSRQVTFQVVIDELDVEPGETVVEDILNAAAVQSDRTSRTPSNEVRTTVTETLPVKEGKPPAEQPGEQPGKLPRTGSGAGPLVNTAVALLGLGLLLLAGSRIGRGARR